MAEASIFSQGAKGLPLPSIALKRNFPRNAMQAKDGSGRHPSVLKLSVSEDTHNKHKDTPRRPVLSYKSEPFPLGVILMFHATSAALPLCTGLPVCISRLFDFFWPTRSSQTRGVSRKGTSAFFFVTSPRRSDGLSKTKHTLTSTEVGLH